jgi:hypothetical protein
MKAQPKPKSPPRAGEVWLEDEHELLCQRFAAGYSLKALMAAHGRSASAITSKLVRLGLLVVVRCDYHAVSQDPWATQEAIQHINEQLALEI